MTDDLELLRDYAENGSQDAFAELVRRNLDLVLATALRLVGDRHRAEDVAQGVFIDLARKACSLKTHPALVSWLYTSARYAALKTIRSEQRRQVREHEAYAMHETNTPSLDWERLRPVLDDVLCQLSSHDRTLILLRYFRGLRFTDVSTQLGLPEGTVRMRLHRALAKLNQLLAARGIRSSTAALSAALVTAQVGAAAPASLVTTITAAALASAAGIGTTASTVGILFLMNKAKVALVSLAILGGLTTAVVDVCARRDLNAQLAAIHVGDFAKLQSDQVRLQSELSALVPQGSESEALVRLRARVATLKERPPGVVDAELHAPRYRGRATPAAAIETFCWAVDQGNLDLTASFMTFTDDSEENRAAFMAQFSEPLRARYRTPERLYAAACFGAVIVGKHAIPDPAVAVQVLDIKERDGPDQVKIKLWFRTASGREVPSEVTYQRRDDGWAEKPISLLNAHLVPLVRARLDPVTGNYIPPDKTPPRS
jgi:RNA polymerase sigma factor (sigma-70 family)